jgi:glycosyltransferase involved in cell wall biosynthesis
MKMNRILASVIIRTYNEQDHIGRLLEGAFGQTIKNIEVIIIDSGSSDDTLKVASQFPVQVYEIKPQEFSFGRSLNLGCKKSVGEFLILASAHVYPVYADWIEKLIVPFHDSNVALVYGKQRGNHATRYSEHKIFEKWFPDRSNFFQDQPFCNNANAAIRRVTWQALPYDESLSGLEDLDWAKRAMKLAKRIVYTADAEVVHVHNEAPSGIYNRYRREALALKRIFPEERFSFWDFVRLFCANFVMDSYHAKHDHVLGKNMCDIFRFRLMQFWGTYRGYAQRGPITAELRQTFYYPGALTRAHPQADSSTMRSRIEYT